MEEEDKSTNENLTTDTVVEPMSHEHQVATSLLNESQKQSTPPVF